jgi:hypothetical protein
MLGAQVTDLSRCVFVRNGVGAYFVYRLKEITPGMSFFYASLSTNIRVYFT